MNRTGYTTQMRSASLGLLASLLMLGNCMAGSDAASGSLTAEKPDMWMIVGEQRFGITLADATAAQSLAALTPLVLEMSDLNRNEKYAALPRALPVKTSRPGTIRNGDLMLYGKDTLVVFYKDFNSTYAYTRLGHVNDTSRLAQALGQGTVQVTFTHD